MERGAGRAIVKTIFLTSATKLGRAISFTLRHTYVCPCVSVILYSIVRVSATPPTVLR